MRRAVVLFAVIPFVLAACGVSAESQPRELPPEAIQALQGVGPENNAGPGLLYELWFVKDNRLVPVDRQSEEVPTPEEDLLLLQAGPTAEEKELGLRTAVIPVVADSPLVSTAEAAGVSVPTGEDQVAVVLGEKFSDLPSQEQLLILGQVVLTLAAEPGKSVLFVSSTGTPVGVPLPNGRLSSGAVKANNYASLMG